MDRDKLENELAMERDRQDLATHLTEQNEKKLRADNDELTQVGYMYCRVHAGCVQSRCRVHACRGSISYVCVYISS